MTEREPATVGVMFTEHVADIPVPDNVHAPLGVNITVPVGSVAPVGDVSVTVAAHDVAWPTNTVEGIHVTDVVVGCNPTAMVEVPWLVA